MQDNMFFFCYRTVDKCNDISKWINLYDTDFRNKFKKSVANITCGI